MMDDVNCMRCCGGRIRFRSRFSTREALEQLVHGRIPSAYMVELTLYQYGFDLEKDRGKGGVDTTDIHAWMIDHPLTAAQMLFKGGGSYE